MKAIKVLILILAVVFIQSCDKNDEIELSDNEYLIFGHFYGECLGEDCIVTYKLTDKKLFEDNNDNYSGTGPFDFNELGIDKFSQVKDLIDYFPKELLNSNETTFGCPDCADQGGIFIQYVKNGDVNSWRIDQSKNDVPDYLHSFIDKVNEKIELINN